MLPCNRCRRPGCLYCDRLASNPSLELLLEKIPSAPLVTAVSPTVAEPPVKVRRGIDPNKPRRSFAQLAEQKRH